VNRAKPATDGRLPPRNQPKPASTCETTRNLRKQENFAPNKWSQSPAFRVLPPDIRRNAGAPRLIALKHRSQTDVATTVEVGFVGGL
jgi:hypothetical protein